jgi:hypothetical protein
MLLSDKKNNLPEYETAWMYLIIIMLNEGSQMVYTQKMNVYILE